MYRIAARPELLVAMVVVMAAGVAEGHPILDLPNGGEELLAGSPFTVTWHPQPAHPMGDWDLWYSTTGPTGPWTEIALDLYPGDDTPTGGLLTYDWTVPAAYSTEARVRVRQDGTTGEWEDISDADFSIVPEPGSVVLLVLGIVGLLLGRRRS